MTENSFGLPRYPLPLPAESLGRIMNAAHFISRNWEPNLMKNGWASTAIAICLNNLNLEELRELRYWIENGHFRFDYQNYTREPIHLEIC